MEIQIISLCITVCTILISIGSVYGALSTKITMLTKQVEKHNSVVERMTAAETRISGIEKEIDIYHGGDQK